MDAKKLENILFHKRWFIGGGLLLICILFELHGSSIGLYADILQHPELNDVLLGKNRPIRADEWNVFTPLAFSQYYNHFGFFSDIVRGTVTNMFMTYGQAVWDWAMIYRPAQWGYLFLDAGSGLSFFWMGREILLFLVSFEFSWHILTKNRSLSVCYAAMMAFSPLIQWWFSVNSVVEIFLAGQGMALLWCKYLSHAADKSRFLFAAGLLWCVGVYILSLYPAWQVSFGYVFLAILLWITWEKRDCLYVVRKDFPYWIIAAVILFAPIVHAFYISQDMIQIVRATEYPGARFAVGGDWKDNLSTWFLAYSVDIFLPFHDMPIWNNCELAGFFCLAPLGWILFLYLVIVKKQHDIFLYIMVLLSILLTIWAYWEIPASLAKISMLSNVTGNRGRSACEFVHLLLLFRCVSLMAYHRMFPSRYVRIMLAVGIGSLATLFIWHWMPEWLGIRRFIICLVEIAVVVFLISSPLNRGTVIFVLCFMIGIGGTVNPLAHGTSSVSDQPLGKKIEELVAKDDSLWIVEGDGLPLNFPIMFGAPTINSINVYPNLARWELLDPRGNERKTYNRYAHILITMQDNPTNFVLQSVDTFRVNLQSSDIKKLNIKYILSRNALNKYSTNDTVIQTVFEDSGIYVYEVR